MASVAEVFFRLVGNEPNSYDIELIEFSILVSPCIISPHVCREGIFLSLYCPKSSHMHNEGMSRMVSFFFITSLLSSCGLFRTQKEFEMNEMEETVLKNKKGIEFLILPVDKGP